MNTYSSTNSLWCFPFLTGAWANIPQTGWNHHSSQLQCALDMATSINCPSLSLSHSSFILLAGRDYLSLHPETGLAVPLGNWKSSRHPACISVRRDSSWWTHNFFSFKYENYFFKCVALSQYSCLNTPKIDRAMIQAMFNNLSKGEE